MTEVFNGLAIVLGLAAMGGILAKIFRQPVILGYILAGAGYTNWYGGNVSGLVEMMGQIGVTLLLFLVGLELPITELKRMGKVALVTGGGQIVLTTLIGFFIAGALGFDRASAVYIGVALTFSSTIVVVKLLSEKGDLQSLSGKLAVGSLLVQDFVAVGILIVLASFERGGADVGTMGVTLVKGAGLVGVTVWLSEKVFPKIMYWVGKSSELLFISSIGWCLGVAALVAAPVIGFSLEVGGLLAGLSLANTIAHYQILARIKPLRDFFLTLFFVAMGASIKFASLESAILPALALSGYVLIGNPLIMMTILGLLGYKKRTAFLAGLTMGQISEFSLVVIATAVRVGQIPESILGVVTLVGVITMTTGTYMITHGGRIFKDFAKYIPFPNRHKREEDRENDETQLGGHIVLFGHSRIGSALRPALERLGKKVVVVDFNPAVVSELTDKGVTAVYGDAADLEMYDQLDLKSAEMVISTVSDVNDSLQILSNLSGLKKKPLVITTATDRTDADRLYKEGADYVLIPHSVGGEYLAMILDHFGLDREKIAQARQKYQPEVEKL